MNLLESFNGLLEISSMSTPTFTSLIKTQANFFVCEIEIKLFSKIEPHKHCN